MQSIKTAAAALAVATLFAGAAQAATTIYTSRAAFDAATTGRSITDFEENGPGGYTYHGTQYAGANFTVDQAAGSIYTVDPAFDALYSRGTGDVLDLEQGTGVTFINLAAGVRAVGFDWGTGLTANSGLLIDGVDYGQAANPGLGFFGIVSDSDIGSISLNRNGEFYVLDNLTIANVTGVPEPAAWALMILGFGAVGAAARRKTAMAAPA